MRLPVPILLVLAACGSASTPPAPPRSQGPRAELVMAQVQPYLDGEILSGGVIALIDGDKVETYGFGRVREGDAAPPGEDTLFEIGSITKVFTALLVGDSAGRGEVALDTPIAQLLPFGVRLPTKDSAPILVGHLLTHTSGLPSVPPSLVERAADANPYEGYTVEALYDDLGRIQLDAEPGQRFEYSNFGYAVLGLGVARKAGGEWPALVTERLLKPLGLRHTYAGAPADVQARLAPGHDSDLAVTPAWSFGAIAPAGAILSTVGDMAAFVRANLAAKAAKQPDPMAVLLARGQDVVVEGTGSGATRALAWFVDEKGRRWHNGGTGGHHAFMAFDPERRQGVVVLAATSTSLVDRLGEAMLGILAGDPPAPVTFPQAAALQPLVGTYDLQGTPVMVTLKGRRLYARSAEDAPTRLVPLSATEFLIEKAEALVVFDVEGGAAKRFALLLGGEKLVAERSDAAPPAPAP